jgi:hypothetical protein
MNPAVLAISVLASIAAALVFAALYAIFAKPLTPGGKKRQQEVINGFQIARGILLGWVLVGSLVGFAGIALGFNPSDDWPKPVAALIAVSAFVLIALMIQRWAKYFAGWIGYGVLNGLLMASTGHILNNPAILVRRSYALEMTGLVIVSGLASLRFAEGYELHVAEKLALLTWLTAFTVAANAERFGIPALTVGTLALVFAWWLHRFKPRRRRHVPRHERKLESDLGPLKHRSGTP